MNNVAVRLIVALFCLSSFGAVAQDAPPFQEGAVVQVTAVRTQPGKFNEYMDYLMKGAYHQIMSEAQKQGVLTSFTVYGALPRSPHDADLYIVETYPNMAAFDGLSERMNALSNKVFGSMPQADQADAERESLRTILGTEIIRELKPRK